MYHKIFFFLISFFISSAQLYCMNNIPSSNLTEKNQLLINAVQNNNFLEVESLLKQGAHSNTKNKDDFPLLHIACKNENVLIAQELFKYGADVNAVDKDGKTALFQIITINNADKKQELLELLINKNIKINQKDKKNNVALSRACCTGHLKTVQFLIQNGAKADKLCLQYAHNAPSNSNEIYTLCNNNLFPDVQQEHNVSAAATIILIFALFSYAITQYIDIFNYI